MSRYPHLTAEQYRVLFEHGTEPPFDNAYWNEKRAGSYQCAACGSLLFDASQKYNSGTGWPSFWDVSDASRVEIHGDTSHGMLRDEVRCATCKGHLGHVFEDGPKPTGLRYCMNSAALLFIPAAKEPLA